MLFHMEASHQEDEAERSARTLQPRVKGLSAAKEMLDLAVEVLAIAQEVDGIDEKNRLIRAALAWQRAAQGELDNVGGAGNWTKLHDAAGLVIARLSHDG